MNTNEIVTTNEQLIETAEDMIKTDSNKGFKATIGIGLSLLVCGVAYKCAIKPIMSKIKSKKKKEIVDEVDENKVVNIIDYHEDLEENE